MSRLRAFQQGDDRPLVQLANRAYAPFGGHVVRDVEGWRWSILDRPGVTAADILILESESGAMEGYGVLGPDGVVLELCLDPDLAGRARSAAVVALVRALEERCRSRDLDLITLELPTSDDEVRRVLLGGGYREEPTQSLTVNLIDLPAFLRAILNHHRPSLPAEWEADYILDIAPGTYPKHRGTRLHVRIGREVEVDEAGTDASAPAAATAIEIATDLSAITEIVFGRSSFKAAREAGRIQVELGPSEQMACTLFELMTIRSPWYTPPADGR
jgi:hypothetical protein